MSEVQETLRRTVALGWYGSGAERAEFMCIALGNAVEQGAITPDDYYKARRGVEEYTALVSKGKASVLSWALYRAGLIPRGSAMLWAAGPGKDFYNAWDERPDLSGDDNAD